MGQAGSTHKGVGKALAEERVRAEIAVKLHMATGGKGSHREILESAFKASDADGDGTIDFFSTQRNRRQYRRTPHRRTLRASTPDEQPRPMMLLRPACQEADCFSGCASHDLDMQRRDLVGSCGLLSRVE
jgi:hypothetical protein